MLEPEMGRDEVGRRRLEVQSKTQSHPALAPQIQSILVGISPYFTRFKVTVRSLRRSTMAVNSEQESVRTAVAVLYGH